ncbi:MULTISPECIES: hypothetical protein [unclassified Pseudomonas]|uniref:hypothetical protein n=1 Tax=unclassified Pseudomonas TaxID=196821 RepID=UPI000CD289BB|nr:MULTISPECIES: hypothetical protein [unclassified Pseudomonas]POA52081.1 hypothetical protein C1889_24090 [Pseudomonas sp. FW507-12TSA]
MPEEIKPPEHIENALGYSRNYATAKPNIGNTEKEHILGLANLLEKTALEAEALRKDAERYRWLRDKSESVHQFYLSTPIWFTGVKFIKENVDSTIDIAMAQEVQP